MEKSSLLLKNKLFQLMRKIDQIKFDQAALKGLSPRESELLVLLAFNLDDQTKSISVSELGSLLQITPAGVTHLLNPLEEAGCIERRRDANDRRVVLVGLTAVGYETSQELIRNIQQTLDGLMSYLGEEESEMLVQLMAKVVDFFNAQAVS